MDGIEILKTFLVSKISFSNVAVQEGREMGVEISSLDIYNDLLVSEKTFYGAAVVGSLKRTIGMDNFHNTLVNFLIHFISYVSN